MVGLPPVTRTPYALEPAPVGVPELITLSFNCGLPPPTSTPVVLAPPDPVIDMFSMVPLTEAVTVPEIVVPVLLPLFQELSKPPVTVIPDARANPL